MNNLEKVFTTIKSHCSKATRIAEISCFDEIARETGIARSRLGMYLDHLQELGLIKYSIADGYLYLTSLGRRQESPQASVAR